MRKSIWFWSVPFLLTVVESMRGGTAEAGSGPGSGRWVSQSVRVLGADEVTAIQVAKRPRVDGLLNDWDLTRAVPVVKQPFGSDEGGGDVQVRAAFAFDLANFYLAVDVRDDRFEFRDRGWRYGDGFLVTFGNAAGGPTTERFVSFGFACEAGDSPKPVIVNRDGEFFPTESLEDVELAVTVDQSARQLRYEVAIPWRHLAPLRPLVFPTWGINLTYVDNDAGRRSMVQLVGDFAADTEQTRWRRVRPIRFQPLDSPNLQCQADFQRRFVAAGETLDLALGCVFPKNAKNYGLRVAVSSGERTIASKRLDLPTRLRGWTILRTPIDLGAVDTGRYTTEITLLANSERMFSATEEIFVVGPDALSLYQEFLELAKSRTASHPLMPSLEIRIGWIQEFLSDASPAANPDRLSDWLAETRSLIKLLQTKDPVWTGRGGVFRFAHRSPTDGRPQPYSVFVPKEYSAARPPPLLVTLHGSGVDEQSTIKSAVKKFGEQGWLILSPKARGLSDWYLGPAGDDVIEAIDHLQSILPFDRKRVFLEGFSMGGYGAWRLGLRHPTLFSAVAIESGAVEPPVSISGERVISLLERAGSRLPAFLIVHGSKDDAISVEPIRQVVARLRELRIEHEFLELPASAHGNYDVSERVASWFKAHGG